MLVGEICNREVAICRPDISIQDAAKIMRDEHVGDVIVAEEKDGKNIPVGILTDRDIVIETLAEDISTSQVAVKDIMSTELVCADEDDFIIETIKKMQIKGVRRVPIVNKEGGLEGILTVDDTIELIAEIFADLVKLYRHEFSHELKTRK
jgi:CBS domain-containing protein